MPKFRKKPVVIEAFQLTDASRRDNSDWPQWAHHAWNEGAGGPGALWPADGDNLFAGTLEGNHLVTVGDWIIQGVKGEIYPCKPDIFAATYDPA